VSQNFFVRIQILWEELSRKIQRDPESIVVAEDQERIVGNIYIVEDGWTAMVFRLAVVEEYRGRDIDRMLGAKAEEIIKGRGHRSYVIFVNENKVDILGHYYKRLGFEKFDGKHQLFRKELR